MQKQNQVTEERSNTALEYVLEHAVPLQQVFKVEGHKKINFLLLLLLFIKFFQAFNIALLKCLSYLFSLFILYIWSPCQLRYRVHRKT